MVFVKSSSPSPEPALSSPEDDASKSNLSSSRGEQVDTVDQLPDSSLPFTAAAFKSATSASLNQAAAFEVEHYQVDSEAERWERGGGTAEFPMMAGGDSSRAGGNTEREEDGPGGDGGHGHHHGR